MNEKETIHVVQGRSGLVFIATSNYEKAKEVKDSLNSLERDRCVLSTWIDGKNVFND